MYMDSQTHYSPWHWQRFFLLTHHKAKPSRNRYGDHNGFKAIFCQLVVGISSQAASCRRDSLKFSHYRHANSKQELSETTSVGQALP